MILVLLALLTGQAPTSTPFELIEEATRLNCPVSDDVCLGREFALRERADQSVRRASAAALGCADRDQQCIGAAWAGVDKNNLARLKRIVGARGWPPLEGEAARGAWLIAQHADPSTTGADRAFRDLVLPLVWEEVRAGRLEPQDYARMTDRNALTDGELQPFGTNQACRDGKFDQTTIDSVEEVDRRRREIGMDIMLSEALPLWDSFCERAASEARLPDPAGAEERAS